MMEAKGFKRLFTEYSLMMLGAVILAVLVTQYFFSYQMVLEFAKKHFAHLAKQSSLLIDEKDTQAREIVSILGNTSEVNSKAGFDAQEKNLLKLFATPMIHNNRIFSLYIGYPDRTYLEVVNVRHSPAVTKMFNAPPGARWIVVKVLRKIPDQEIATRISHFYDENFTYLSDLKETTRYDPLKRPWYIDAMKHGGVVRSKAYRFYRLKKMGITYSMPLKDGQSVLAMDLTLEGLSQFLKELKSNTHTEIYMIEGDKVIASTEGIDTPVDAEIMRLISEKANQIHLYQKEGKEYLSMAIATSAPDTRPIYLAFKVEKAQMMKPYLRTIFAELLVTLAVVLLLLPLVRYLAGRFSHSIDLIMEENEKVKNRVFEKVTSIRSNIQELNQLSDSLVEMAQSIKEHEQKQEELLEAFIHLIADIIDAKSPYTGEHCRRVPLLTNRMIKEANYSNKGSLKEFQISDKETLKGIEWSAWLHDCGKLVVPDYVIDKATKLETVYNRIHEIRTRFEVLLRDARIEALESIIHGGSPEEEMERYRKKKEKLLDDFTFVASMNLGDRKVTEEDIQRLKELSEIRWERNFPKTIGISWQERELMDADADSNLPVREQLIADGPEYQIPRKPSDFKLYQEEEVTMHIPTLLYNRGELYNLCIRQGTITEEEKFKIQEHAIHTLRILKELPWSDKLRPIVEDAANHHEHLDGTGYPRSLDEKQLSIPARIMVIADIFEALTSADRPYKRSKTLSQALEIMVAMVQSQKIDAELFALFIESEIYLEFAHNHLQPHQIDLEKIDKEQILKEIRP